MLGLDALILLRNKNFLVFSSVHSCLRCHWRSITSLPTLSDRSWHEKRHRLDDARPVPEIFFMLALPFFTKRFGIKKYYCLVWSPLRSAMASLFTVVG